MDVTPSWKEWELLCDTDNRQQQSISRDETSMSGEHLVIVDIEAEESMSNEIYDDKTCLNSIPTKLDDLLPSARFNETNEPSVEDEQTNSSTYKLKSCSRLTGPIVILVVLSVIFVILGREYLVQTLTWLEQLRLIPSICVFVALFTIVSFPFGFGYIILNMAAGYLYGLVRGQVVVTLSVAIGFTIAFVVCRCCLKNWAMQYVSKSTALLAMKSIVEGPHGIRVIVFTRFTPIPFGLQNTLFAITDVSYLKTIVASIIGLFPTQVINTYMGSTVRSMTEVLADRADGYIILAVQVIFSIFLSYYLIRKARLELAKLSNSPEGTEVDLESAR